jgi:hypothetical protein
MSIIELEAEVASFLPQLDFHCTALTTLVSSIISKIPYSTRCFLSYVPPGQLVSFAILVLDFRGFVLFFLVGGRFGWVAMELR